MLVYLLCHQYFHQAFEHREVIPSRLAFMKNKIKQKLKLKKKTTRLMIKMLTVRVERRVTSQLRLL